MLYRLLLFLLAIQLNTLHAQNANHWALSAGIEVHHFAKATPGYFTTDLHYNHKRSIFSIGYSFSLYAQEFEDNDPITPLEMRIPTLNIYYTYKFIDANRGSRISVGSTVGYKLGLWREVGSTFNLQYETPQDDDQTQVTNVELVEKFESDQHHFYLGVHCEYPFRKIRFMASFNMGVVLRGSYHFDEETTHYNQGAPTKLRYYYDVTPVAYLSRSWYAKLGVIVPFSVFRNRTNKDRLIINSDAGVEGE